MVGAVLLCRYLWPCGLWDCFFPRLPLLLGPLVVGCVLEFVFLPFGRPGRSPLGGPPVVLPGAVGLVLVVNLLIVGGFCRSVDFVVMPVTRLGCSILQTFGLPCLMILVVNLALGTLVLSQYRSPLHWVWCNGWPLAWYVLVCRASWPVMY